MSSPLVWHELAWRRPIGADQVQQVLRLWAHDPGQSALALEARAERGRVRYLLGATAARLPAASRVVASVMTGSQPIAYEDTREQVRSVFRIDVRGAAVPLRTDPPIDLVRSLLAGLGHAGRLGVVQLLLGRRFTARLPRPQQTTTAPERARLDEPGFEVVLRIGTSGEHRQLLGLVTALRTLQSAGLRLHLRRERPARLNAATWPWFWSRLTVTDVVPLTLWPVGDGALPGVRDLHPTLLPQATNREHEYVLADSTAPGQHPPLGMDTTGTMRGTVIIGPPGVGKSTLLTNAVMRDIELGHGVVLIDPKGDVVEDVLARVPASRRNDVVVLDPTDESPVGLNPLSGGSPDVRAEALLQIFTSLYGDSIGARSRDVLHHTLLSMARHGGMSLPMLPLVLSNDAVRRRVVAPEVAKDPLALGAFWGWYEHLSAAERSSVVAPVLNKVRFFTTNRRLRAVIGQRSPRFSLGQVFSHHAIVLVPLQAGIIGSDAARLLGSLVLAEVWQATLAQAVVPERERPRVVVTVDELPQFTSGVTDFAELLAVSRGLGCGYRVALQGLYQVPRPLKEALLGTVRSRVVFRTGHRDASELAKGHPEITAEDLTSLAAYEIYASLTDGNTSTPYASGRTRTLTPVLTDARRLRAYSRERWGHDRGATERELLDVAGLGVEPDDQPLGRVRRTAQDSQDGAR